VFTGIITHQGKVRKASDNKLVIESDLANSLMVGDSISVSGICLTVIESRENSFSVDFIQETNDKTNIGLLKENDLVNLELPATPSSLLSGHIVQGHVDTTAKVKEIKSEENQKTFVFELRDNLSKYMVDKGSITINGVSLTIIKVHDKKFSVGVIPHTYEVTQFSRLKTGDIVNIEVDVLAKYVEKLTEGKDE
jgi:riboflavin synthase